MNHASEAGKISTTVSLIELTESKGGAGILSVFGKKSCHDGDPSSIRIIAHDPLSKPQLSLNNCASEIKTDGLSNIQWYFNGAEVNSNANSFNSAETGEYQVSVNNFCGTVFSEKINVTPVSDQSLVIQNVITPNGDGKNDFFYVYKNPGVNNTYFEVFNRWGAPVFHSSDYQNNWDGQDLAAGVYYFRFDNQCLARPNEGWVQIVRQ